MGWTAHEVLSTSLSDFSIMRNAWKQMHCAEPEDAGLSRKEAMEIKAWLEETRG